MSVFAILRISSEFPCGPIALVYTDHRTIWVSNSTLYLRILDQTRLPEFTVLRAHIIVTLNNR